MLFHIAEATGCQTLKAANAVLECCVASDFEAGDHRVIYATVTGAKVLAQVRLSKTLPAHDMDSCNLFRF